MPYNCRGKYHKPYKRNYSLQVSQQIHEKVGTLARSAGVPQYEVTTMLMEFALASMGTELNVRLIALKSREEAVKAAFEDIKKQQNELKNIVDLSNLEESIPVVKVR